MNRKEKKEQREKLKLDQYNAVCDGFKADGYFQKDVFIEGLSFYISFLCLAPFLIPLGVFYFLNFYGTETLQPPNGDSTIGAIVFGVLLIGSFVLHEVLHGIGWCVASKMKWSHIHFNVDGEMPTCHVDVPIKGTQYTIGALTPFVILGLGGMAVAFIVPGLIQFLLAVTSITMASADLLIALRMVKYKNAMIVDHPIKAGFTAFFKS